ncbi:MAG: hypothetical protein Ct9H300mP11_30670 [Chloroflexota bacterium]|nr:MAG: hypothetical protein Ct9H300mP11_30670 [Chloroflexota bacterium]
MINSNPETVSTDFDASDRLYFEPLDEEAVRDILENEEVDHESPASVVQFGGQTAFKPFSITRGRRLTYFWVQALK